MVLNPWPRPQPMPSTMGPDGLQPQCPRCKKHRHLPGLPCWSGDYVKRLRLLVFEVYGTTCHLCGNPGADTVDHLHPRSLGGLDSLDNLKPAHRFCNTGRGAAALPTPPVTTEQSDRW